MICLDSDLNDLFTIVWMSRNSLLEKGAIYEDQVIATGLESTTTYFVKRTLISVTKQTKWFG